MIIINDRTGKPLPQRVMAYIGQIYPLPDGTYDSEKVEEIKSALSVEKNNVQGDYGDWTSAVKSLDILPGKDFFLGVDNIKLFDIEESIITDTDRAKVIVYDIHDKDLVQQIISKKKTRQYVILKFISPRVIDKLVSMRKYYRKLLQLCDSSTEYLTLCTEGITITNGTNTGGNSKQRKQPSAETNG